MSQSLASKSKASPSGSRVMRNAFNKETFIFPLFLDDPGKICNDVVLEKGGCGGGGDGLVHVHPLADEIFMLRSGALKVVLKDRIQLVEPGEMVVIPRGTPHFFANASDGDTEFSVQFAPPQQHRRFFANFATTTRLHPDWFSKTGKPNFLLIALILDSYRDHLYLAGLPVAFQKLLFALLAPIARLRGYRLEIKPDMSR